MTQAVVNVENMSPDYFPVPMTKIGGGYMSGVEIHAHIASNLLSGEMIDQGPIYTGVLNNYGCSQIGVYLVDQTGNLIGDISTPDELRPLKVYMPTWDARSIFTTDSVSNKVLLSFNFDRTLSDGDFGFVAADSCS